MSVVLKLQYLTKSISMHGIAKMLVDTTREGVILITGAPRVDAACVLVDEKDQADSKGCYVSGNYFPWSAIYGVDDGDRMHVFEADIPYSQLKKEDRVKYV